MDEEKHKKRHIELHKCLDELLANFLNDTGKYPSQTKVIELMKWSYRQTIIQNGN